MIDLSHAYRIGAGNERICYAHPDNPNLCIKVYHSMDEILKHTKVVRQQNEMEHYYFDKLAQRHVPFLYIPKCHGWVETTLGKGLVFDRVIDEDGSPSQPLTQLLAQGVVSQQEAKQFLEQIQQYLLKYAIAVCDVSPGHILMQKQDGQWVPKVIDGIGSRYNDWKLYLLTYVHVMARRKTRVLWQKLIATMINDEHK